MSTNIMSEACQRLDCSSEHEYLCECQNPSIRLCASHLQDHLANDGQHNPVPTAFEISRERWESMKHRFSQALNLLGQSRSAVKEKALESVNKIIDLMLYDMQTIREKEILIRSARQYLDERERIMIRPVLSSAETIILDNRDSNNLLIELREMQDKMVDGLSLGENFESIEPNNELIEIQRGKFENAEIVAKLDMVDLDFSPRSFHYFEEGTKIFCSINPFSDIDTKRELNIEDNLSLHPAYCALPGNKHFYYGGIAGTSNYTYIIDCNDFTAVKRTSYRPKDRVFNCCYYNGYIFLFGGFTNGQQLAESEKYCIEDDRWFDIASLPQQSNNNHCELMNSSIIISGAHINEIYSYNIADNTYSVLTATNLPRGGGKILFEANNLLYVYSQGELYRSVDSTCNEFILLDKYAIRYRYGGTTFHNCSLCYPIKYRGAVYFLEAGYIIYRLDLATNKTLMIRQVRFPN
jgi:hypothetical protein